MDAKLRALERAYKQSQSNEDLGHLVRERLRLGLITDDALRLAADFGRAPLPEFASSESHDIDNPILRFLSRAEGYDLSVDEPWPYAYSTNIRMYVAVMFESQPYWEQAFQIDKGKIPDFIPRDFPAQFFSKIRPHLASDLEDMQDRENYYGYIKDDLLLDCYFDKDHPEAPQIIYGFNSACLNLISSIAWHDELEMMGHIFLLPAIAGRDWEHFDPAEPGAEVLGVIAKAEQRYCDWAFGHCELY